MPRVEATVTTRPCDSTRAGSAARTTAAVPSRLTATTRFQRSAEIPSRGPQASIPAAVTTPWRPPCASTTLRVAASAAFVSARSTSTNSMPSAGRRSKPTAVPSSRSTASATARPSPEAAPVTIVVPISALATRAHLLDQPRRRAALQVGQDRDPSAPGGDRLRLGQLAGLVVAALRPDIGLQQPQGLVGDRLVEDRDLVDTAQGLQHRRPLQLADQRAIVALEPAHRAIAVEQDDEAVAERPRRLQGADVADVEEVEAAAGRDHAAAPRPHTRRQGERRRDRARRGAQAAQVERPRRGLAVRSVPIWAPNVRRVLGGGEAAGAAGGHELARGVDGGGDGLGARRAGGQGGSGGDREAVPRPARVALRGRAAELADRLVRLGEQGAVAAARDADRLDTPGGKQRPGQLAGRPRGRMRRLWT